jgi:hypothetical protein
LQWGRWCRLELITVPHPCEAVGSVSHLGASASGTADPAARFVLEGVYRNFFLMDFRCLGFNTSHFDTTIVDWGWTESHALQYVMCVLTVDAIMYLACYIKQCYTFL